MAKPLSELDNLERKIKRTIARAIRREIKRLGPITLENAGSVVDEVWLSLLERKQFLREPRDECLRGRVKWQS